MIAGIDADTRFFSEDAIGHRSRRNCSWLREKERRTLTYDWLDASRPKLVPLSRRVRGSVLEAEPKCIENAVFLQFVLLLKSYIYPVSSEPLLSLDLRPIETEER